MERKEKKITDKRFGATDEAAGILGLLTRKKLLKTADNVIHTGSLSSAALHSFYPLSSQTPESQEGGNSNSNNSVNMLTLQFSLELSEKYKITNDINGCRRVLIHLF